MSELFKGRNLGNSLEDLSRDGWRKVEGNWGTKTVFEKKVENVKYYAMWEPSNLDHSTNGSPTNYWKLTIDKIMATSKNTIRVSDAANFKTK